MEIFVGSYACCNSWSGGGRTTLSIIQRNYFSYQVVWQEESERRVVTMHSFSQGLGGTTYALVGQEGGLLSLYDLSERAKIKTTTIFSPDEEIYKIFHADLDRDGTRELLVFGRKTDSFGDAAAQLVVLQVSLTAGGEIIFSERLRSQPLGTGDVVLGAFVPAYNSSRSDLVFASGEIFHLDPKTWSLAQMSSFNTNLGTILQAFDVDGDQLDEVFGTQEHTVYVHLKIF
jgi:hypothetical protein